MSAKTTSKTVLQIRLDDITHAKTKIIAEMELRSLNAQMEYFIMKGVQQFEKENGQIMHRDADGNVLPF